MRTSPERRQLSRWLGHWLPLFAWAGLIFWASSRPASALPSLSFPHADKLVHALEFGIFAILVQRALLFEAPDLRPKPAFIASMIIAAAYAVTDELHQALEPTGTRIPSLGDVLADVLGALVFGGAFFLWKRSSRQNGRGAPP